MLAPTRHKGPPAESQGLGPNPTRRRSFVSTAAPVPGTPGHPATTTPNPSSTPNPRRPAHVEGPDNADTAAARVSRRLR